MENILAKDTPVSESLATTSDRNNLKVKNLTSRIKRYENAKAISKRNSNYILTKGKIHSKLAKSVSLCSDYLTFHNYYTIEQVRLVDAFFCKKHLICPMCARRRASKLIGTYLTKFEKILKEKPHLKPYFVTKTVKNGSDLTERFNHLKESERVLRKRKSRANTKSITSIIQGGITSFEATFNHSTGEWHPHSHAILFCTEQPDKYKLSSEWHKITGDSYIVDVVHIQRNKLIESLLELFKYVTKFHELDGKRTFELYQSLSGKRTIQPFGCLYGLVTEPDKLTDDELNFALPYIEYVYRYLGNSYKLSPV